MLKDSHTRWIPPAQGSCNELDAFVKMVRALKEDDIDLGLPGESAEFVWRRFRNRIAHMAHPDGVSAVYAPQRATTSEESEARIRQSGPAFQKVEGDWQCRVDRFALDIRDIGEWLCVKIIASSDYQRLNALGEWIFHEEEYEEKEALSEA